MGSRMNFVDAVRDEVFNPKQQTLGTGLPLTRQNSVFSLTFDEFQNSWGGGVGKDFGSMNMDELLKSIWTAEENHSMMTNNMTAMNSGDNNGGCFVGGGGLQRQGSVTLPRTVSQKRVDDVWKELMKEEDDTGVPQRQQTLGEITLEEFLLKVGVVREEPQQQVERVDNFSEGLYGFGSHAGLSSAPNGFGPNFSGNGAMVSPNLLTTQTQPLQMQQPKLERPFPKQQDTIAFSQPPTQCLEVKPSILGVQDRPMNTNLLQGVDFKTGGTVVAVSTGSQMSPELTPKSNMDASLPPVPYMFGRARKTGAVLEKVIERKHKRMIKNRESASRSRARKQAYTLELEAEVAQLKELNEELHRKQVEIMEEQKKQLVEPMRQPLDCKRQCLRRTSTGPW